jgi:hypothetical protein
MLFQLHRLRGITSCENCHRYITYKNLGEEIVNNYKELTYYFQGVWEWFTFIGVIGCCVGDLMVKLPWLHNLHAAIYFT